MHLNEPVSSLDDFALTGDAAGYVGSVPAYWTHGPGIGFGGYLCALGVRACAISSSMNVIVSCATQFVGVARAGPVRVAVKTLIAGRSTSCVQAELWQEGLLTSIVTTWLSSESFSDGGPAELPPAREPKSCELILFQRDFVSFRSAFEERAIDFPSQETEFCRGPSHVDLWMRARNELRLDPIVGAQLVDILAFDSHLLQSTRRARQSLEIDTSSLDLCITWSSVTPAYSWRRLRTTSGPANGRFAKTRGVLAGAEGALIAEAMQLGLVRHPK